MCVWKNVSFFFKSWKKLLLPKTMFLVWLTAPYWLLSSTNRLLFFWSRSSSRVVLKSSDLSRVRNYKLFGLFLSFLLCLFPICSIILCNCVCACYAFLYSSFESMRENLCVYVNKISRMKPITIAYCRLKSSLSFDVFHVSFSLPNHLLLPFVVFGYRFHSTIPSYMLNNSG